MFNFKFEDKLVNIDVYDASKGETFSFRVPKDKPFSYPKDKVFDELEEVKTFLPKDVEAKRNKILTIYLTKEQEEFLERYSEYYWKNMDISGEPYYNKTRKSFAPQFGENLDQRQIAGFNTMFSCKDIIIDRYKYYQKTQEGNEKVKA